ncbi:hypothetical protein [Subtercola boreus]|uniref:Uncharacterized protein n=1 Tax=Subtercola boreus TaxID=120213 RepID=A0A3E0WFB9_9MICO|nr:hypothetical protein [Subtercola boreus]RFA22793.1 hypothetical protein B7R24_04110 [Subtercola boreus]RFA23148.1 hypothetical protein B7R23_04105 [Subtercola boreus]RFA28901.1 hypothetical protein B7R25_04120 [Subtercola boreus]
MNMPHCAVCSCADLPGDQLIVALGGGLGLAAVCETHGEAIRSGALRARPVGSELQFVELELLPAA